MPTIGDGASVMERISRHLAHVEDDKCFLGHPGSMKACQDYQPPAKIDPAPIDQEAAAKFRRAGL